MQASPLMAVLLLALFFLPGVIAAFRERTNTGLILLVSLLASPLLLSGIFPGVLVWLVALLWSLSDDGRANLERFARCKRSGMSRRSRR